MPPVESFVCDADGTMATDGTYTYEWDAENGLISVAPASSPVAGDKKLEFVYDYTRRRVRKTVYDYSGVVWSETADLLFVYDKWNVVMVLDANASNATLQKYTWGLDMSGLGGATEPRAQASGPSGIHGAGGIGGLLALEKGLKQGWVETVG